MTWHLLELAVGIIALQVWGGIAACAILAPLIWYEARRRKRQTTLIRDGA